MILVTTTYRLSPIIDDKLRGGVMIREETRHVVHMGPVVANLVSIIAGCYYIVDNRISTQAVGHHRTYCIAGLLGAQLLPWEGSSDGGFCGCARDVAMTLA